MRGNYKTIKKLVCGKVREFVLMPTYDGEIKELWQEWTEDKDAYYVYSYGKIIDGEFKHRYVGIGEFKRYKQAKRHNTPLMGNMRENQYYKIIVSMTQTREDAGILESKMIKKIGRKDLGIGDLYNLSDGGESGSSGWIPTKATRAKISASLSGKNHPLYGKTHSIETRAKMSATRTKDRSHITEEVLFQYLQFSKAWVSKIPTDWGFSSHSVLRKMIKKRYGTGSATKVQKILADKLGKRILNHANFIEYCKLHKYEFLQMANYYFGISGEQLQRWCLRTYKIADSNTINGWEKCAKRLERIRKYRAKKRTTRKKILNYKTL